MLAMRKSKGTALSSLTIFNAYGLTSDGVESLRAEVDNLEWDGKV